MKFRPEPWAEAFVNAAGSAFAAEEALENLRVFCRAALMLPGDLSGRNDADRLGRCITAALAFVSGRETAKRMPESGGTDVAGFASRFIQLMLRKNCFHCYKRILREIEKAIYRQKGIEEVIVETAVELEGGILEAIREKALYLTGARDIKLISRVIPDLIGGLRLRWGGIVLDGSVKRQLEKMARDISALSGYSGQELEA
jgi:F-type H+-transporting ATPase subunit delta